ncbi:MAG: hypothetical protein ACI4M6_03270 [Christensenellaceae bacterium]
MHGQAIHNVLLVCEIIIGIFGIISAIAAEDWHDRVHSIFVFFLALEGLLSYILDGEHIVTEILLVLITVTAVILAVLSVKPAVRHVKKLCGKMRKKKNEEELTIINDVEQ